jgi:hypothetical protein
MKKKFSSKKHKSFIIFNNSKNNISKININSSIRSQYTPTSKATNFINEEIYYYDKSQKEILLSLIKNSQLNLLMQLNMIDDNEKMNAIKDFLKDLKGFLAYLLNEKIKNKDNLQLNVNTKKERLQTEISNNSKYDRKIKDNNIIKRKNKSFQKNVDTEMVEKNYVGSELSKLRLQNFKTENEIKKTDFSIFNLRRTLILLKNTIIFPEENREIYCQNNLNQEKIDNGFNYMIQMEKDKLDNTRKKIQEKKEEQGQYIKAINKIKCDITTRNNILEKDIIYELSIENRITSNS